MDQEHVILSFQLSCSGKCFPFESNSHSTFVKYVCMYVRPYISVTADTADMVPTVVLAIWQILYISD